MTGTDGSIEPPLRIDPATCNALAVTPAGPRPQVVRMRDTAKVSQPF
ncbi:hypothetical protein FB470_000479 [Amycolatopsis thermophila]|uniref:Uncharacterized protein n=1 Tax=Amycolatopsis thermophila TaxID=206084 RepID=A0ABU0EMH3_9PSEU|nr:hypothetical protein [Amycolatopsis thermophila]